MEWWQTVLIFLLGVFTGAVCATTARLPYFGKRKRKKDKIEQHTSTQGEQKTDKVNDQNTDTQTEQNK